MEVVSRRSQAAASQRSVANSVDAKRGTAPSATVAKHSDKLEPAKGSVGTLEGSSRSVSVFDPSKHHPPRIDQFGYNKETHKGRELLNRNAKNVLSQPVRVPQWWHSKLIPGSHLRSGSG